jgi:hypothetical protein
LPAAAVKERKKERKNYKLQILEFGSFFSSKDLLNSSSQLLQSPVPIVGGPF